MLGVLVKLMSNASQKIANTSKSAIVGYLGAIFMMVGFISEWNDTSSQANIFKAINLAGATAAICLAGICQHTKEASRNS